MGDPTHRGRQDRSVVVYYQGKIMVDEAVPGQGLEIEVDGEQVYHD